MLGRQKDGVRLSTVSCRPHACLHFVAAMGRMSGGNTGQHSHGKESGPTVWTFRDSERVSVWDGFLG